MRRKLFFSVGTQSAIHEHFRVYAQTKLTSVGYSIRMVDEIAKIAQNIADYEGEPTRQGEPAGTSTRGKDFEREVAEGIVSALRIISGTDAFLCYCNLVFKNKQKICILLVNNSLQKAIALRFDSEAMNEFLIKSQGIKKCVDIEKEKSIEEIEEIKQKLNGYISTRYKVSSWVDGRLEDIKQRGWIPSYCNLDDYKKNYSNSETVFDLTVVLLEKENNDKWNLHKKYLIECKSAKSSSGGRIDGNAHERFSYQNLDFLEIALMHENEPYEILLFTNKAFLSYSNKYHAGFCVHALRLMEKYPCYRFNIVSTEEQYARLLNEWKTWLTEGNDWEEYND